MRATRVRTVRRSDQAFARLSAAALLAPHRLAGVGLPLRRRVRPTPFAASTSRRVFAMGYTTQDIRNVALVGQAGAGKTLLLEALLLQAGIVRNKGSVQRGSTVSDFDPQERRLQHSIDTAICSFDTNPHHFTIIDTPGYMDFLGRAFAVLEAVESTAIVVSATAGIDLVTGRLMDFSEDRGLCRMIIINKIDSRDAHPEQLLAELRSRFGV